MSNKLTLNDNPSNISLLENNKFKFTIPNLSFATYFCQAVSLPGVGTISAEQPTPFHVMKRHGDRLTYEPLQIQALLDEDLRLYEQTFKWLESVTGPQGFHQYKKGTKTGEIYNDGILEFHKNSNLSNVRFKFHNCCITNISGIEMSAAVGEPENPLASISIDYDTFTIERL